MGGIGEIVIGKLIEKVWEYWRTRPDSQDALSSLEISLIRIQPTIVKVENIWTKDENLRQKVNRLLVLLKDAAYDAEDLLDKFQFRELRQQIKQQIDEASDSSSSSSFYSSRQTKRRKVGKDKDYGNVSEIIKIREKLDSISIAMEKLLDSDNKGKMHMINEMNRVKSSFPVETQVFGRDNELNKLKKLLLNEDRAGSTSGSNSNMETLTVTGIGGVGKTTFAQEAYNDKRVEEYFKLRIWVCVSEDFNVKRLTRDILESATRKKCDLLNFDVLQVVLKEEIASKKFLLVLDDVWNEDMHMWDSLCAPLRSGAMGSKILVTTRNVKIANMMGNVNPIHLDGLDDVSSWAFFKKCAFGSQNSRDHPRLEAIAKDMVPKLKGLPLAARTLGGLLNMNMNEQHWMTIMESEILKLPQEESGVLSVLQLSYLYLPAHLKRCFAFCSLFPKDYEFREHELIQIWMAEGFFPTLENISVVDFGSGCFLELVSRSFFQKSPYQDSNTYVMHDLIHELAQLISGEETYRLEDGKLSKIHNMFRHLNIIGTMGDKELRRMTEFHDFYKLRTLICPCNDSFMSSELTRVVFNRLQSIRTLILKGRELRELPENIGDFIHLRYLDISGNLRIRKLPKSLFQLYNLQILILDRCDLRELPNSIGDLLYLIYLDISQNNNLKKLPESLCGLSNLQTLSLRYCYGLQSLPQGMSRLINLRKLDADDDLVSKVTRVGKLRYLQSLSLFNVGKEHGHKLAELSDLSQLHGTLRITSLENVMSREEAAAAELHSKVYLDELVLQWTTDQEDDALCVSEEVLEHIRPNSRMKRLTISGYSGARPPSWLEPMSLKELESLSLIDCIQWDDLSFIRRLSHLKSLLLERMPAMRRINERDGKGKNVLSLDKLNVDNTALLTVSPLRNTLPFIKILIIKCSVEVHMFEGEDREMLRSLVLLKYLVLENCKNLRSLPIELHALPSLELLEINECQQIRSLPEKGLPNSLKDLHFNNCHSTLEKQLDEHLAEMKNSGRFRQIYPWDYEHYNKELTASVVEDGSR